MSKRLTNKQIVQIIVFFGACHEAIDWCQLRGGGVKTLWNSCPNYFWMSWLCIKLNVPQKKAFRMAGVVHDSVFFRTSDAESAMRAGAIEFAKFVSVDEMQASAMKKLRGRNYSRQFRLTFGNDSGIVLSS